MDRHRVGSTAKQILVVEDDAITRLVISEYLAAHGYRVALAASGPEGLTSFRANPPDLVLLDVLLPRKNGFVTCFEMKQEEHGKRTPILLMSAVVRRTPEAEDLLRELRAEELLQKPFDLEELLARVRKLIGEP
jgi:DNA-binding response OmpR family regulator